MSKYTQCTGFNVEPLAIPKQEPETRMLEEEIMLSGYHMDVF